MIVCPKFIPLIRHDPDHRASQTSSCAAKEPLLICLCLPINTTRACTRNLKRTPACAHAWTLQMPAEERRGEAQPPLMRHRWALILFFLPAITASCWALFLSPAPSSPIISLLNNFPECRSGGGCKESLFTNPRAAIPSQRPKKADRDPPRGGAAVWGRCTPINRVGAFNAAVNYCRGGKQPIKSISYLVWRRQRRE